MIIPGHKILTFFAVTCLCSSGQAAESVEDEIEFLIQSVAVSGCEFERNGNRYNADDAADHLRLKHRRGKRYATSAETFIDRLASKSSWTGKQYLIICPETGEHTANAWLYASLNAHRRQK